MIAPGRARNPCWVLERLPRLLKPATSPKVLIPLPSLQQPPSVPRSSTVHPAPERQRTACGIPAALVLVPATSPRSLMAKAYVVGPPRPGNRDIPVPGVYKNALLRVPSRPLTPTIAPASLTSWAVLNKSPGSVPRSCTAHPPADMVHTAACIAPELTALPPT